MGTRRRSRELALTALFEMEFNSIRYEAVVKRLADEEGLIDEASDFFRLLVKSYADNSSRVNQDIEAHSDHWKISRMALVDRNILRLGTTEIIFCQDIPKSVTINEYLEIAKKYGAKVFVTDNPPIFHINKQRAVDRAKGDWILQLDAEEVVPEALSIEIRTVIPAIEPGSRQEKDWIPGQARNDEVIPFMFRINRKYPARFPGLATPRFPVQYRRSCSPISYAPFCCLP